VAGHLGVEVVLEVIGQLEEIDRVIRDYPGLNDDEFVAEHRDEWLRG